MGVREGLLALLADGPQHGYQLKLDFEAATGEVWPLNVGQIYTTLQRLERDALVEAGEADAEGRISYRITDAGRTELADWYATPVDRRAPSRDEVTMKLLLALTGRGGTDPTAVVAIQRAATMTALQDYTRLKADADPEDAAWTLQLERLVMIAEAELRWLDRVEDRLDLVPRRPPGPAVLTDDSHDPDATASAPGRAAARTTQGEK